MAEPVDPAAYGTKIYEYGPFTITQFTNAQIVKFDLPNVHHATIEVFVPKMTANGLHNAGSNVVVWAAPHPIESTNYLAEYYGRLSNQVRHADTKWMSASGYTTNATRWTNVVVVSGDGRYGPSYFGTLSGVYIMASLPWIYTNANYSQTGIGYGEIYWTSLSGGYWWIHGSIDSSKPFGFRAPSAGNWPGTSFPMGGNYSFAFGPNATNYYGSLSVNVQSLPWYNKVFSGSTTCRFDVADLQNGIQVLGTVGSNTPFKVRVFVPYHP